jgi:DNA-binding transcriptional LysR family regulator
MFNCQIVKVKTRSVMGQLTDMDIRLLRVFKSVVDCGGMAAAELELNIGTSTISRHIKDLETRLGLSLCRRGRGGFAVTMEGERIYQETLRLLTSADQFRSSVDDIHRRMGGQLNISIHDKTVSNPAAKIGEAIALFCERAPGVTLNMHVASINPIERGVLDGQYHVGIIPAHRSSDSLLYSGLFDETMLMYCGAQHPLFDVSHAKLDWGDMYPYHFAGLGYHSPNMEISQQMRLSRKATGFDQEAIATLILSGRYLGFLPDHYAEGFVARNLMRAIRPKQFHYKCNFVGILRRSPQPSRVSQAFWECLLLAHGKPLQAI